tara:strand:- start:68915 stop:69586 length:672 start_codon:yes stop_codon:yes gene_type:complete
MILEAKHLRKSFDNGKGTLSVLRGLSLEVQEGELVTIMGQSGCGKSTLLNILGTLDNSDSGQLKINGNDIEGYNKNQLSQLRNREIGFVFQSHHLLPDFTAIENILMPSWILNEKSAKSDFAIELLKRVGLLQRKDHFPSQLSGGEKARVALIRSLINKPRLILADEPTGNLDQKNALKLIDLLIEINKNYRQSIVLTSHNPDVASIGNQKLVLKNGKLINRD